MRLGGFSAFPPPPPPPPYTHTHTFSDSKITFFQFGYTDLSLTTQTKFSNLTILNTHKQRTDKLCLEAVANEFVALLLMTIGKTTLAPSENPTLKCPGNTQPLRVLGLASKTIHLNFGLTWGPGCNLLF